MNNIRHRASWTGHSPALILMILAAVFIFEVRLKFAAMQEDVEQKLMQFDRLRSVAKYAVPELQIENEPRLDVALEGDSEASRNATFATVVKSLADVNALQVLRSEAIASSEKGQTIHEFQLTGNFQNFLNFLASAQQTQPRIHFKKIVMSNPSAAASDQSTETPMNFELRLTAINRAGP